jgi:hypothetical protein
MAHRQARALYLECPRTASHATVAYLEALGFERVAPHHAPLTSCPFEVNERWSVATTIRNPFDVWVSWYFSSPEWHSKRRFDSEWMGHMVDHNPHIQPGRFFWRYAPTATVVMRYETLDVDLANWIAGLGIVLPFKGIGIDRRNISTERMWKNWRMYYSEETRRHVEVTHRDELVELGYGW